MAQSIEKMMLVVVVLIMLTVSGIFGEMIERRTDAYATHINTSLVSGLTMTTSAIAK